MDTNSNSAETHCCADASILTANRPMDRTAFRAKSTSTSVAYLPSVRLIGKVFTPLILQVL